MLFRQVEAHNSDQVKFILYPNLGFEELFCIKIVTFHKNRPQRFLLITGLIC
jgi:hypothetical protein